MKHLVLICSLFLAWQVEASVLVNEVMYDPIGTDANSEWIELINTDSKAIDITGWKLFEANSNHGLTVSRGTFVIPSNGFIIIADNGPQFILDNPGYSGSVLDSTFSLSNTGEVFEIRNKALETQDSLNYLASIGASENGATLTRVSNGNWIEGVATPGILNNETPYASSGGGGQNTGSGSGSSSGSGTNSGSGSGSSSSGASGSSGGTTNSNTANFAKGIKKEKVKNFKPYYKISLEKDKEVVTVATPVTLDTLVEYVEPRGTSQIMSGITYISFGDGTKTVLPKILPVTHEWQRAGTYTVVVSYKSSELFSKPFVTLRQVVEVINPTITLSVDDTNSITITNSGSDTLDISNWYITQGVHDTQLPLETYVEKDSSFTLSNQLVVYEGGALELLTSSGVSVVDYIPETFSENNSTTSYPLSAVHEKAETQNSEIDSLLQESGIQVSSNEEQNKSQTFDWLAFVSLLGLLITYCISRFVIFGSFISFSFVDMSESVEILDEISEGAFFS